MLKFDEKAMQEIMGMSAQEVIDEYDVDVSRVEEISNALQSGKFAWGGSPTSYFAGNGMVFEGYFNAMPDVGMLNTYLVIALSEAGDLRIVDSKEAFEPVARWDVEPVAQLGSSVTEAFVADLGVDVKPGAWYVVSDSGAMYGGVENSFASEVQATNWALRQPEIDLGDVDQVIQGVDIIAAYQAESALMKEGRGMQKRAMVQALSSESFVADLGVEVDPEKYYVVSDSGMMYGGVENAFDTEAEAFNYAMQDAEGFDPDVDAVMKGSEIIAVYQAESAPMKEGRGMQKRAMVQALSSEAEASGDLGEQVAAMILQAGKEHRINGGSYEGILNKLPEDALDTLYTKAVGVGMKHAEVDATDGSFDQKMAMVDFLKGNKELIKSINGLPKNANPIYRGANSVFNLSPEGYTQALEIARKAGFNESMEEKLTVAQWKEKVLASFPNAQFTQEDGSGKTYGEVGEWTAHTGPDMQADVVGIYSKDFCNVETEGSMAGIDDTPEYGVTGGLNESTRNHKVGDRVEYGNSIYQIINITDGHAILQDQSGNSTKVALNKLGKNYRLGESKAPFAGLTKSEIVDGLVDVVGGILEGPEEMNALSSFEEEIKASDKDQYTWGELNDMFIAHGLGSDPLVWARSVLEADAEEDMGDFNESVQYMKSDNKSWGSYHDSASFSRKDAEQLAAQVGGTATQDPSGSWLVRKTVNSAADQRQRFNRSLRDESAEDSTDGLSKDRVINELIDEVGAAIEDSNADAYNGLMAFEAEINESSKDFFSWDELTEMFDRHGLNQEDLDWFRSMNEAARPFVNDQTTLGESDLGAMNPAKESEEIVVGNTVKVKNKRSQDGKWFPDHYKVTKVDGDSVCVNVQGATYSFKRKVLQRVSESSCNDLFYVEAARDGKTYNVVETGTGKIVANHATWREAEDDRVERTKSGGIRESEELVAPGTVGQNSMIVRLSSDEQEAKLAGWAEEEGIELDWEDYDRENNPVLYTNRRGKKWLYQAVPLLSESIGDEPGTLGQDSFGKFIVDSILGNEQGVALVSFREGTSDEGDYAVVMNPNGNIVEGVPLPELSAMVASCSSFNDALTKFQNKVAEAAKGNTNGASAFPVVGLQIDDPLASVTEGSSIVSTHEYRGKSADVYKEPSGKFRVRFYRDGKPMPQNTDLVTKDKEKAQKAAKEWIAEAVDVDSELLDNIGPALIRAKQVSKDEGCVQHVNKSKDTGNYYVSDWYDYEETVASFNNGRLSDSNLPPGVEEYFNYFQESSIYSARLTANDVWRVFERGNPVAVAGPFETSKEASDWIKKKDVKESFQTSPFETAGMNVEYNEDRTKAIVHIKDEAQMTKFQKVVTTFGNAQGIGKVEYKISDAEDELYTAEVELIQHDSGKASDQFMKEMDPNGDN